MKYDIDGQSYWFESHFAFLPIAWLIFFTLFVALSALVVHEFNHLWAAAMMGDPSNHAWFEFQYILGFPIPTSGWAGVKLNWFTKLAGGFFTGIIYLIIGGFAHITKTVQDYYVEFGFLSVGLAHFLYSFWELFFIWNIDMNIYSLGAKIIQGLAMVTIFIVGYSDFKNYVIKRGGLEL